VSAGLPPDGVIAIDGPAGSGKSTTAKALATRFGLLYVDTGAMYRALTRAALDAGIAAADETHLADLLRAATIDLKPGKREGIVIWNGRDVSAAIRTPEVDAVVSTVAAQPAVRRSMVSRQRALGRRGGVVMEGRDIGSVVFPLATAKIYLDASLEARADRRCRQFRERGEQLARTQVIAELAARDKLHSDRAESPLTISPDAIVLDTSRWSLERQIDEAARAALLNPYLDTLIDTDLRLARLNQPWHYRTCFRLFKLFARFFGMRLHGSPGGAIPAGTIIVCNHVSWYDPPLVGAWLERYPIHTIAKEELFKTPLSNWLFRSLNTIPIHRKGYDPKAFGEAQAALRGGANLFVFPEGTRRAIGHPGPVKAGIGILAQETGADIQPLFIRGSCGLQPGGSTDSPLELSYGPILRLHALGALQARYELREISRRIAALVQTVFEELQARSFERFPETEFEMRTGQVLLKKFARKNARLFGN